MAEIIFQSKLDAKRFHSHLLECLQDNLNNLDILLIEDRHIVEIIDNGLTKVAFNNVKTAFYEFIIKIKRDDWFREMLKERYYYEDPEEQQQIIEIIHSVLEGQREEVALLLKQKNEEPKIKQAVDEVFLNHVPFSFDSFYKFRLRPYLQMLESYVEVSIDEYKMEQEYQMFVQTLREFLSNREPKIESIHLLFDEEITFFNEQFVEIKRSELTRMIDRKLLFNHPVYVDSASIAPLLSIAPTNILIYTNNHEAPLVRTIKNIFEERVTLKTYNGLRKTLEDFQKKTPANENKA